VTFAIEFNRQLQLRTIEIGYVRPDRMLAPELETIRLAILEQPPKTTFGWRRLATQTLRL
jgi:hypothetical protein